MARWLKVILLCLFVTGCAGFQRGCSSWQAERFGSDWVVVQYAMSGAPFNCWVLRGTSITNEDKSDGIYWLDSNTNHLVHISGWYDRVQVANGDFTRAASLVGVDLNKCGDGHYPSDALHAPMVR